MCHMTITSIYPSQSVSLSVSQHIDMNSQVECFVLFPRERERATQTYQCRNSITTHIESHRSNKA